MTLTIRPDMQRAIGPGGQMLGSPNAYVFQYAVEGLPTGTALIRDMRATRHDGRWRISRLAPWMDWEGDFESHQDAFAALQAGRQQCVGVGGASVSGAEIDGRRAQAPGVLFIG